MTNRITCVAPNPSGLCMCGCGEKTPIARYSNTQRGHKAGHPMRFLYGHHHRTRYLSPVEYIEQDCGHSSPCWVWQRGINPSGYGRKRVDGRQRSAHRAYYEALVGPVPDGLQLDHLCRNRACVNPAHLEPVTPAENIRRSSRTNLTHDDVETIRNLAIGGVSPTQIAERLAIRPHQVRSILRGERWAVSPTRGDDPT